MTHLISGEWQEGSGDLIKSLNPATGGVIWQGKAASPAEVTAAVMAARKALLSWSVLSFQDRLQFLEKFTSLLKENSGLVTDAISRDAGKVTWDAAGEVAAMTGKLAISVQAYQERTPTRSGEQGTIRTRLTHRPHGVMAVFGPYNFPGHLPNGHIIPALLAGNTIVFKPSEKTPLVAEEIVKLWQQAGLPDGVINLVQGGAPTGEALIKSKDINGVLFTGSHQTGKAISKALIDRPNVIQALELGGNNPLIIGTVADHRAAAIIAINSAYITSGQRCTCARRLIVPLGSQGDNFIAVLQNALTKITVGAAGDAEDAFMGPVIDDRAADLVLKAQKDLKENGARLLTPVKRLPRGRAFLSPGLMDVTDVKNRPDTEIFGPLLQVIRVKNFSAALEEANNTAFGLAAGLLSDDLEQYNAFHDKIRAGIVNWNQQLTGASSAAPFGGIGLSGNFRPSAYYAADYVAYASASIENPANKVTAITAPKGLDF